MSEPASAGSAWPASEDLAPAGGWQPLPPRARLPFAMTWAVPALALGLPLAFVLVVLAGLPWWLAGGMPLATALTGLWLGLRQFRPIAWRLDGDGLAIRRGRLWQRETRVPATRVQHLDVRRGPWERRLGLATVVVHTAGTRNSSVTVPLLPEADAEHLRDVLGRQRDVDSDADSDDA